MQLLKINKRNKFFALRVLKRGGVVVFPTETVYGLAADLFNLKAMQKTYQIKGRSFKKPLPLIADGLETVNKFFAMNKKEKELAKKYWPGALTLVLKIRNKKLETQIKKIKMQKYKNIRELAVRVSSNKVARKLAQGLGGLVISTSANLSGQAECTSVSAVNKQFRNKKHQPDLILDGGRLKKSPPSTIVEVMNGKIKIIRAGAVKI